MASLTESLEIPFFEVTDGEGELRTQNLPGQAQRESITDRGSETRFKVQARLHTCIHGTLKNSSEPKIPASLIVLEYQLKSLEMHSSFETVYTQLTFREVKNKNKNQEPSSSSPSLPNVKRLEPFEDSERWNITTEDVARKSYGEAGAGVNVGPVKLEGKMGGENESAHEQKHFIEGDAGRHYKNEAQVYDRAWWNIKQNQSQEDGIPRNFRVAVLLERSSDADFEAKFTLDVKAGFRYTSSKIWEWCRGKTDIDDPILFRPLLPPQGDTKGIDPNNLAEVDLAALCPVWGLVKGAN